MQKMALISLMILSLTAGCSTVSYYGQAARGQLFLLVNATSTESLLKDPNTNSALSVQLKKAQQYLTFAEASGLPVGNSYSKYVDVERPFVVWNVFAAPKHSTTLVEHCFPIAGCVGYRGFFDEAAARAYAQTLKAQDLDVYVGGVAAYSTLGWLNDPLLNTFIFRDDERLAAVLFHELAHKVLYVPGDTVFNESFATAVERHLLKAWLSNNNQQATYDAFLASAERRQQVIKLILTTRQGLADLYASDAHEIQKTRQKQQQIETLRARYRQLQSEWGEGLEFSGWIEQDLNNAHLAAIGAYQSYVPGFTQLLNNEGSLDAFFLEVEQLSRLPMNERHKHLNELADQG